MKYCPLLHDQYGHMSECRGKHCAMAVDETGNCLIQQALKCYVAGHAQIIPDTKEPTDEELMHMAKRIANLPIQFFPNN